MNQFTKIFEGSQEQAIYIWSIPFNANPKLKVFLLSCSGMDEDNESLSRNQQILLDLTNLLSSALGVVNIPDLKIHKNKRIFSEEITNKRRKEDWLDFIVK